MCFWSAHSVVLIAIKLSFSESLAITHCGYSVLWMSEDMAKILQTSLVPNLCNWLGVCFLVNLVIRIVVDEGWGGLWPLFSEISHTKSLAVLMLSRLSKSDKAHTKA